MDYTYTFWIIPWINYTRFIINKVSSLTFTLYNFDYSLNYFIPPERLQFAHTEFSSDSHNSKETSINTDNGWNKGA